MDFLLLKKRKISFKTNHIKKEKNECTICFENQSNTPLECGHSLCLQCCIKHFRKNENCPFCRKTICRYENRKQEIDDAIRNQMETVFVFEEYNKEMDTYEFLKFKGIKKEDIKEIISVFRDSIHVIMNELQTYNEDDTDDEFEDVEDIDIPNDQIQSL